MSGLRSNPGGISPRITEALGLRPGDSAEAHVAAAARVRADSVLTHAQTDLANERRAAEDRRVAALPSWAQDMVGKHAAGVIDSVRVALQLPEGSGKSEIVKLLDELFAAGGTAAEKQVAAAVFANVVTELCQADTKLTYGDAQLRASRAHPELAAAAMGR